MLIFFKIEYILTKSDDPEGLPGAHQIKATGKTTNPAAWGDSIAATNQTIDITKMQGKTSKWSSSKK
ncbi:MAG: hypothetical protein V4724_20330 [Pseudomonadota bacterium]